MAKLVQKPSVESLTTLKQDSKDAYEEIEPTIIDTELPTTVSPLETINTLRIAKKETTDSS